MVEAALESCCEALAMHWVDQEGSVIPEVRSQVGPPHVVITVGHLVLSSRMCIPSDHWLRKTCTGYLLHVCTQLLLTPHIRT